MSTRDRLVGTLLGTAVGDALGLVTEGMSAHAIARRFGRVERYRLLGRTGFVSDDTEQSALVAQALIRHRRDPVACAKAFRWSLLGWFARLPWGLGFGTLRACLRIGLGFRRSGVMSAGNGAAMRAAITGVVLADDAAMRAEMSRALAEVTHVDPRAVAGAMFVADVAAACARGSPNVDRAVLVRECLDAVEEPAIHASVTLALVQASSGVDVRAAATVLGNTGFIVHTAALATFCFVRSGGMPRDALVETVSAGGDTDSIAAIVGAWLGALHGETGLPHDLVAHLQRGPFGQAHLRALGEALSDGSVGVGAPTFSAAVAMARNLALLPIVFVQGARAAVGV